MRIRREAKLASQPDITRLWHHPRVLLDAIGNKVNARQTMRV